MRNNGRIVAPAAVDVLLAPAAPTRATPTIPPRHGVCWEMHASAKHELSTFAPSMPVRACHFYPTSAPVYSPSLITQRCTYRTVPPRFTPQSPLPLHCTAVRLLRRPRGTKSLVSPQLRPFSTRSVADFPRRPCAPCDAPTICPACLPACPAHRTLCRP
jgi:hypothetical protein